ncbi:hypothetical protein V8B97DRAFT_211211 [Scleroderma yunnanense]
MNGTWPRGADEYRWDNYARAVHARMEVAVLGNVNRILELPNPSIIHAHIPRSIWGVKLTVSKLYELNSYIIKIDVIQCTGCCTPTPRPFDPTFRVFNPGFDYPTLKLYGEIRKQFKALMKSHAEHTLPEDSSKSQAVDNKLCTPEAITFFADIFSVKRFRDWIGDIYCFRDLPSLVPTRATEVGDMSELSLNASVDQNSGVILENPRGEERCFSVNPSLFTHHTSDAEREYKALIELELHVKMLVATLTKKLTPSERFQDPEDIIGQLMCEAEDLKSENFGVEAGFRTGQHRRCLFSGGDSFSE